MTKKKTVPESPLSVPMKKYTIIKYRASDRYDYDYQSDCQINEFNDPAEYALTNYSEVHTFRNRRFDSGPYGQVEFFIFVDGQRILSSESPLFLPVMKACEDRIAEIQRIEAERMKAIKAEQERNRRLQKRKQEAEELVIYEKIRAKLEKEGKA